MVYGLADLGYFEKRIFAAVAGRAKEIARHGSEQHLCNILWAFAIANQVGLHERGETSGGGVTFLTTFLTLNFRCSCSPTLVRMSAERRQEVYQGRAEPAERF